MKNKTKDDHRGENRFLYGFFAGLLLVLGCGAGFPYKWFYIDLDSKTLVGEKPSDDLPISICNKDLQGEKTCVALKKETFKALYLDYLDTKNKLIKCEEGQ